MSCVYTVECNVCGESLEIAKVYLDSTQDLCVDVSACKTCKEESYQKGLEKGREPVVT